MGQFACSEKEAFSWDLAAVQKIYMPTNCTTPILSKWGVTVGRKWNIHVSVYPKRNLNFVSEVCDIIRFILISHTSEKET